MNTPILELRNIAKSFLTPRTGGKVVVFEDFSLVVEKQNSDPGGFVVILGPSGSGKTTLLNLISGLLRPERGDVVVLNHKVNGPHRYSATVPQSYTCLPWLTVVRNVEFGLRLQGTPKQEATRIALENLRKVELEDRAHSYPQELSGGMQQRIALARTLAVRRPVVLMDEPFGALDAQTRADMQQMLLLLWKEERSTIVFVTHDITEALLLADRIVVLSPRPANIICDLQVPFRLSGSPDVINTPEFSNCSRDLRDLLRQAQRDSTGRVQS
jgi:NitT/TauT family transport system ATP-binding protein